MGEGSTRVAVVKTGDIVEGRYRIISTLGAGGMGTVYLAEHTLIKRRVAMKILHPDLATDAGVVERFMNEARAAGTLGHPNIVESTDMGFSEKHVPYIVFEYLEGALLTDEIYRVGGLPVRRAIKIADQIASALHAAHSANIIHRDLKSDNVFLTDKDEQLDHVKVLDFGISRFLEADERQRGVVMGTPEFMAPEQITNPDGVDTRTDIYALGVILYEMLTARRPFQNNDDPRRLMHRIVNDLPPPLLRPEVPPALAQIIVERMLAKDPSERFQSMADVQVALEQFATRDGTPRRRSAPLASMSFDDDGPETIVRPAKPRPTPWPVDTIDGATPVAVGQITLPPPMMKRPYAMYGIAGAGILMGIVGLVVGMRGGDPTHAPAPQPVAQATAPAVQAPVRSEPQKIAVSLEADAPDARIVFRRRVAPAPVALTINATDVIELVEVSAPGYRTTRYWLTFDRPTLLKAHLVKGSGSLEATEEETLAALGEVILVKDPAPVVVAAPVVALRTVTKPAPIADPDLAPRKIGKAAPASVTEPAAPPAKLAEPEPEPEPVAEAVADLVPVPVPVPVPDLNSDPNSDPTSGPTSDPTSDPPPAVIERLRPVLDKATVSTVIATHRPEVLKCFAEGKKKNSAMRGTLMLQLQVDATGVVRRTQVQSSLQTPIVAACVVKAANTWRFPVRPGGETATVAYPFTIN